MAGIIHRVANPGLTKSQFKEFVGLYLELLIELTPVDTGFCSQQWHAAINASYTVATFTNTADYAEYLDRGWSKQAPSGMTGPADAQIDELVQQVT